MAAKATNTAHHYNRFWREVIGFGFFVLLLILFGPFAAASSSIAPPRNVSPFTISLALYFGIIMLATLSHEIGHALGAWSIGWRVNAIVVWRVAFQPNSRKFSFVTSRGSGDFLGYVLATPLNYKVWNWSEALFILGGVAANFVFAAASYAAAISRQFGPVASVCLATFSLVSLGMGVLNLLPIRGPGRLRLDGAIFLDFLRRRTDQPLETATKLSRSADTSNPKNWDPVLVAQVEDDVAAGSAPHLAYDLLYFRYMALADVVRARVVLEQIARNVGETDFVRIDRAFFIAYVDKDGSQARSILSSVKRGARGHYNYWRALAVACDALQDKTGALTAVRSARVILDKARAKVDDDDRQLLDAIEGRANMAGVATVAAA
jgi:hypothetical protein